MANHHGNEGVVKVGANVIAEIKSWSLEETQPITDDSSMGDSWQTHKAGAAKSWRGSFDVHWDETDTNGQQACSAGQSVTLNLYPEGDGSGDTYYTGTVTIESVSRSGEMTNIVAATHNFVGNGALTKTTV